MTQQEAIQLAETLNRHRPGGSMLGYSAEALSETEWAIVCRVWASGMTGSHVLAVWSELEQTDSSLLVISKEGG